MNRPDAPEFDKETGWERRLGITFRSRRLIPLIELVTFAVALGIAAASYLIIAGKGPEARLLTPPLVALLLVSNLVPVTVLMVLLARRFAKDRAARSPVGGGGRLHVRLVAVFSVIASVPTLLVVIFASLLFQYGVEFWFSDRARTVLANSDRVAQTYVTENRQRIIGDVVPMAGDIRGALTRLRVDDPPFSEGFARQVAYRVLDEAAILAEGDDHVVRLIAGANLDRRPIEKRLPISVISALRDGLPRVTTQAGDRVEAVIQLDPANHSYLYVSRRVDPVVLAQVARTKNALSDYNAMIKRSRALQLRFNAALLIVSLLLVGAVIWTALIVADRLVRPIGDLMKATRRVTAGDFSARVETPRTHDEIGTLANTFNRMTERIEEQTSALVRANNQIETRRALIEAVLSGISAGVIAVGPDRNVTVLNGPAGRMLEAHPDQSVGQPLGSIAPELDELLNGDDREAVIQLIRDGETRTLAVMIARNGRGYVLTFDDITQQLADQRRAAWADVARRIAHEIKNPLTPIQLAAERLQRRYGKQIVDDSGTFERLTSTIVRQVGDLRRMVDEFSSFARMPKPLFREEVVTDIARQALFLHEVAHPNVRFLFDSPSPPPVLVCDRRQLSQAFINIVKNAVEAIESKEGDTAGTLGTVAMRVAAEGHLIKIMVSDDGTGLPAERERLTEPYMTTRARGTGLGLAIVKKIVEEHFGTIAFQDRPSGGTVVAISFDAAALSHMSEQSEEAREADDASDLSRPSIFSSAGNK